VALRDTRALVGRYDPAGVSRLRRHHILSGDVDQWRASTHVIRLVVGTLRARRTSPGRLVPHQCGRG
jgi:hypothetical protein